MGLVGVALRVRSARTPKGRPMAGITDDELIGVLRETAQRHHAAYAGSDGFDPEWPSFYAAFLQTRLWDRLGVLLTRSEIVHVLVAADRDMTRGEAAGDWPDVYAQRLRAFADLKAQRGG